VLKVGREGGPVRLKRKENSDLVKSILNLKGDLTEQKGMAGEQAERIQRREVGSRSSREWKQVKEGCGLDQIQIPLPRKPRGKVVEGEQ